MGNPTTIEPNMPDSLGVRTQQAQSQVGRFDGVYDALSYTSSIAGPAGYYTAAQYRPESADIVGAAVNATAGYSGGTGLGASPGVYSGALPYYGGGGAAALTAGPVRVSAQTVPTSGDVTQQAQQILAESQASSMSMLIIQNEIGQQNRTYTSTSNLMNSRDTMLASIIRNVRVG